MKNRKGNLLMTLGLVLILAALALVGYNQWDASRAQQESDDALMALEQIRIQRQMESQQTAAPPVVTATMMPTDAPATDAPITDAPTGKLYERVPGIEMPGEKVNGHEYIGTLSIPSLGLKVPVQRNWSYENLSVSPCRYSGSAYADNLAIIAHTYHFGKLSSLALDATVTFTDMENNVFRYVVREKNTISPNDANEIAHSDYDLTLVTCTLSGTKRVAVYCERVK